MSKCFVVVENVEIKQFNISESHFLEMSVLLPAPAPIFVQIWDKSKVEMLEFPLGQKF